MSDLATLTRWSAVLQVCIVVFGLLTPALVLVRWRVDLAVGRIKDTIYQEKLAALGPRHLRPEQRAKLRAELGAIAPAPVHTVVAVTQLMDAESTDFGRELLSVFSDAGWKVGSTISSSLSELPGFVTLLVTGDTTKSQGEQKELIHSTYRRVQNALTAAGIDCREGGVPDPQSTLGTGMGPNSIYIVVGRKAPTTPVE